MSEALKGTDVEVLKLKERRLTDLVRATTVLLSDYPPRPVDAIFFHGRSFFDAEKEAYLLSLPI
jgi:hypothetical protein